MVHDGTGILYTRSLLQGQGLGGILLVRAQVLDATYAMVTTEFWQINFVAQNDEGTITGAVVPLLTTPATQSVSGLMFVLETTGARMEIRATAAAIVGYHILLTFRSVEV